MYHKYYLVLLNMLIICKFECVNTNLIRRLLMPNSLQSRSSKMNLRREPIRNKMINPSFNTFSLSNDYLLPYTLSQQPSFFFEPFDTSSLQTSLQIESSPSFLFTSSLPKNIPLKLPKKFPKNLSLNNLRPINHRPNNYYQNDHHSNNYHQNNHRLNNLSSFSPALNNLSFKPTINRPTFVKPLNNHFDKTITKLINNNQLNNDKIKPSSNYKSVFKPSSTELINTALLNENYLPNRPLPIDSPLIFNTSLIKNRPTTIDLPNTPLSSMNFYYLIDEDKPDYFKSQATNQDCLKTLNDLKSTNAKLNELKNFKKINRNDLKRDHFFNLKKSTNKSPSFKLNRKHNANKNKSSKDKLAKNKRKNVSKKKAITRKRIKNVSASKKVSTKNKMKNLKVQPLYPTNEFLIFPNYLLKNLNQYEIKNIQPIQYYPIKSKRPIKKPIKKKKSKNRLVNSSSNDKYVVIKSTKKPTTNSKTSSNSKTNQSNFKSTKRPMNKLKEPPKEKPPIVFKNAIYLNKKNTQREMLNAFHQSTLEEDLNIIKEIISDYNTLGNKNPAVNQYYLNTDYKLIDNNNQISNLDDNYIFK